MSNTIWPFFWSRLPGRLVGQDDQRIVRHGSRDRDALAHAAGQLARPLVCGVLHAQFGQQISPPLAHLSPAQFSELAHRHHDVCECREFRQQKVELKDETELFEPEGGKIVIFQRRGLALFQQDVALGRDVEQPQQIEQ